jgi:hypothetical protein
MIGLYNSILSVSVQKNTKQSDWPRGWCDRQQIGPEPRVFSQSIYLNQYTYNVEDVLSVEFALPSDDGLNELLISHKQIGAFIRDGVELHL